MMFINNTSVVLDPHSAIGYQVAKEAKERPIVSLATASPYKFSQDVLDALHQKHTDELESMKQLQTLCLDPIPERFKRFRISGNSS